MLKVERLHDNKLFALKRFLANQSVMGAQLRARAEREVEVLMRFKHYATSAN